MKNMNIPASSNAKVIAAKTSSEILYGGDLVKVTRQIEDLMQKALVSDLKNPGKDIILNLNNVSITGLW